ncbi:MAG: PTS glucose/sucrose transporter subunit IIB [Actinomycetaceae bacterium]|nr:PTS glucose/sucrose transporter subunit IIB [Actinomycetaceae bacterium]
MSQAKDILEALGGAGNITELDSCITRLRVEVADPQKVDQDALTQAGVFGVVAVGSAIQVVVGPTADQVAEDIAELR